MAHKNTLVEREEKPFSERQVNMSNTLARAAHGLNLSEKRLIAMGLAKTNQVPSQTLFLAKNQGWKMKLSAMEYAEEFKLSHNTAYDQLKSASEKLWHRYIRYIMQTRRGPKEAKFRWVSGVTYHHGEGWVELNFTPEAAPHLLALRKQFTSYKLKHACAFDSIYAWRLYECLKSWQDTGRYTPDIKAFHESMEAPASCRKDFADLRRRVIEPAISAIIEKSDLLLQWKPVKAGRKVIGLEFHFQPNPQLKLSIEAPELKSAEKRAVIEAARLIHSHSTVNARQPQRLRNQRRANGMRPIQIWVPDTRQPEFVAECRRQARNVASNVIHERKVMDWIESVVDLKGWEA